MTAVDYLNIANSLELLIASVCTQSAHGSARGNENRVFAMVKQRFEMFIIKCLLLYFKDALNTPSGLGSSRLKQGCYEYLIVNFHHTI